MSEERTEMREEHFTPYRALPAEGARIALITCLICGATVTLDPGDDPKHPPDQTHLQYHADRGELP